MIADSLSGVHIPLPAVRPRQRSWGTSLPQSVILFCLLHAPLAFYSRIRQGLLHLTVFLVTVSEGRARNHSSLDAEGALEPLVRTRR